MPEWAECSAPDDLFASVLVERNLNHIFPKDRLFWQCGASNTAKLELSLALRLSEMLCEFAIPTSGRAHAAAKVDVGP